MSKAAPRITYEPKTPAVIDAETGAPVALGPVSLFGPDDGAALARMGALAGTLAEVVREAKLATRIRGRDYLRVEAWQTLGGLVGVFGIVTWTRVNEDGNGYLARAEARTLGGDLVGGAEAECSRAEESWADRDPYALRAMAQTRAVSRALRGPLAQIAVLGGFEGTAAEEIPAEPPERATPEARAEVRGLVGQLMQADPATDWPALARTRAGPEASLTASGAADLAAFLRESLDAVRRRPTESGEQGTRAPAPSPDPDTDALDSTSQAEAETAWRAAQAADDEARRRAHRDLALLLRDIEGEGKPPPPGHANWTEFSRHLAAEMFEVQSRSELDAGQIQTLIEAVDAEAGQP